MVEMIPFETKHLTSSLSIFAVVVLICLSQLPALESAAARNLIACDLVRFKVGEDQSVPVDLAWLVRLRLSSTANVRGRYLAGTYFLWLSDPLSAQAALEAGSGTDGDPLAGWMLTEALIAQGKTDKAAAVLAQAGIPTDTLARWGDANWSLVNQGSGDDVRADLYFTVADAQGGGSWTAQRSLGRWWLFRHDDPQWALAYLLSAQALNPGDAYTLSLIAESYRRIGDINCAIEYMERSDQLYGDRMPWRPGLAQLYLERNQPGDIIRARDALKPFLQRNPNNEFAQQVMERIQKRLR